MLLQHSQDRYVSETFLSLLPAIFTSVRKQCRLINFIVGRNLLLGEQCDTTDCDAVTDGSFDTDNGFTWTPANQSFEIFLEQSELISRYFVRAECDDDYEIKLRCMFFCCYCSRFSEVPFLYF